ncbi:hypothetical protein ACLBXX_19105 [Microbacterium sp. C23T]
MTAGSTVAGTPRMGAGRIAVRGWRIFVPVVIGNALVQALTTAPFLTPAMDAGFVLLAVASAAALVASTALIVAHARAAVEPTRVRLTWRLVVAASVTVIVVGVVAVVALPAMPVALALAFVVLPGVARGGVLSGFRVFGVAPGRAIALTLVTLVAIVLLWVGALLLGFLITGPVSAALVWVAFGAVAVVLTAAWTALGRRG